VFSSHFPWKLDKRCNLCGKHQLMRIDSRGCGKRRRKARRISQTQRKTSGSRTEKWKTRTETQIGPGRKRNLQGVRRVAGRWRDRHRQDLDLSNWDPTYGTPLAFKFEANKQKASLDDTFY
jgi:hypothetical protein